MEITTKEFKYLLPQVKILLVLASFNTCSTLLIRKLISYLV